MKNFKNYLLLMMSIAGAITLTSCSNDSEEDITTNSEMNFSAEYPKFNEEGTRTMINKSGLAMWKVHDKLKLFLDYGDNNGHNVVTSNSRPTTFAGFIFNDKNIRQDFISKVPKSRSLVAVLGPDDSRYIKDGNYITFGDGHQTNKQIIERNNVCSEADFLISKRVPAKSINTRGSNILYFKRLTSLLKIRIKADDDEEVRDFLKTFKAKRGWLTTGNTLGMSETDNLSSVLDDQTIYYDNNFAGKAKVELSRTRSNNYIVNKEPGQGCGIELLAETSGQADKDYFYSWAEDDYINVFVLPTKLNGGEQFTIILDNGEGRIIRKKAVVSYNKELNFKAGYAYRLNMKISKRNIY